MQFSAGTAALEPGRWKAAGLTALLPSSFDASAASAIWLRSKCDVKNVCMSLSPPMNSETSPARRKERDTRERASPLRPGLFTSRLRISLSREMRAWPGPFHRYPARLRSFRMQPSILRYEQTTLHNLRDCVHTAAANFSTWGDALRIMQRSHRVHLSAPDRTSC